MKKEQGAVFDRRVGAVPNVSVTVYNHGTAEKPTIYSDNGITPQTNPFQTDSLGRWAFYVANGRYDIEFSGSAINTYKMEDVLVEDAAAADAVSIRGHTVDETDLGNDKVLVYKTSGDKFIYEDKGTPSGHKTSHQDGGGDEISVAGLDGEPSTLTTHKNLATGVHGVGGGTIATVEDIVATKLDDFAAPDNTVDLDVSITKHGLCPKAPDDATKYLNGVGAYSVPAGGGGAKKRLIFPAACFETRAATGWAGFTQVQGTYCDYATLDFDKDVDEKANTPPFVFEDYDLGNIMIKIGWIGNATSGNVAWVASLGGKADGDPWDAALTDHAFAVDTIQNTAYDLNISTLVVDPAEIAADEATCMKIWRDISEDNLAVDARLLWVQVEYTEA